MKAKLAIILLPTLAVALPAQGYEWDHPDGIGVRYLLYKKMQKRDVNPEHEGPNLRLAYTPTDQSDWVRIKGYPMDWGVLVYEFSKEDGRGEASAESFEDFLVHKDPYLKSYRRDITVHGDPVGGGTVRMWEYRDRFVPPIYVLDKRAPGGRVWAESDLWKIRFPVEKGMVAWIADEKAQRVAGPNLRSKLRPRREDWVRVKGYSKPRAWHLLVYEFPDGEEPQQSPLWADDFEELVTRREKQDKRAFTVRGAQEKGKGKGLPFRRWEWTDDKRTATGKGLVEHHIAAVYDLPGRQVALLMRYPTASQKLDRKLHGLGAAQVSRLVPSPDAQPDDGVGRQYHYIAATCRLQDKEVAVVVSIPVENGEKPDPDLRARAVKIVKSLRPDK